MFVDIPYITFFTSGVQSEFFQNLRAVLFMAMPLLLIAMAVYFAEHFFSVIRNSFRRDIYGERDSRKDERDYDI